MNDLCDSIFSGDFTLDTLITKCQGMFRLLKKKDITKEVEESYTTKETIIIETIEFAKFLKALSFN
jgi:hypothetical protein